MYTGTCNPAVMWVYIDYDDCFIEVAPHHWEQTSFMYWLNLKICNVIVFYFFDDEIDSSANQFHVLQVFRLCTGTLQVSENGKNLLSGSSVGCTTKLPWILTTCTKYHCILHLRRLENMGPGYPTSHQSIHQDASIWSMGEIISSCKYETTDWTC